VRLLPVAIRHILRCSLPLWSLCLIAYGQGTAPVLTLRVAPEVVSVGGWAQIKVYADSPALIATGALALDLDPRVFGPIASVAAFSASGDATGLAVVTGTHVEVSLRSASGGLGQMPGFPIFTVRAPVLANAVDYGYVALSTPPRPPTASYDPRAVDLTQLWRNPSGVAYSVLMVSENMRTGAVVSIQSVTPAGGVHPVGTKLRIDGSGFNENTRVSADGLIFSSHTVVSATQIEAVLGSSAELSGVRYRIPSQDRILDFYSAFPSAVESLDPPLAALPANIHIIAPVTEWRTTSTFYGGGCCTAVAVVINPSTSPMEMRYTEQPFVGASKQRVFTLAPGAIASLPRPTSMNHYTTESETPFRTVTYFGNTEERGLRTLPATEPTIATVVNAASHVSGAIAPGEVITIRGLGLGTTSTGLILAQDGRIKTDVSPTTHVTIQGVPAPILYASPGQWNVVVPYEVAGSTSASVNLMVDGVESKTWILPVASAAPGIFTLGATGMGRGAVLNQDSTVNSPTNYAPVGTVIQIFATGGGQSGSGDVTGSVTPSTGGGTLRLPVKVIFGGDTEAMVIFAGPAPGLASGVIQVNAVVPRLGVTGSIKPDAMLRLEVDGIRSAPVTVAIR